MPRKYALISGAIKPAYLQKKYREVFPPAGNLLGTRLVAYTPMRYIMLAALPLKELPSVSATPSC